MEMDSIPQDPSIIQPPVRDQSLRNDFFNKKGVVIATIIIIILGIGYFIAKPKIANLINSKQNYTRQNTSPNSQYTPAIPKDWMTYKNEYYGYEISYPQAWIVRPLPNIQQYRIQEADNNQAILIMEKSQNFEDLIGNDINDLPDNSVYLEVVVIPAAITFEDWWLGEEPKYSEIYEATSSPRLFTFPRDKIELKIRETPDEKEELGKLHGYLYYIWKDNFLYILVFKNKEGADTNPILRQIAYTLNPSPNAQLLKWKKHQHELGFSLEIPEIASLITGKRNYVGIIDRIDIYWYYRGLRSLSYGEVRMNVTIYENPNQLSIPQWYKEMMLKTVEGVKQEELDSFRSSQVGIYDGYTRDYPQGAYIYYIPYKDKVYVFSAGSISNEIWHYYVYNQIVNSFRID